MNASSQTDHRPPGRVRAAAGTITAAMAEGHGTPHEIAAALDSVQQLFDPERAEEIASTAHELGVQDSREELTRLRQDAESLDWFHHRLQSVALLCLGRPDDHLLSVGEVRTAADGRKTTSAPLTVTWDGPIAGPSGDSGGEDTLVPCTTSRGGSAVLVLNDEQRLKLGALLAGTSAREVCPTPGCGMADEDLEASDPPVVGSVLVQVAGIDGPAQWWCSPWCASAAVTAAGAELAAADRAAATDPHAQTPAADAEEPASAVPTPHTDPRWLPALAAELYGAARWVATVSEGGAEDLGAEDGGR